MSSSIKVDLHTHSNISDGALEPVQLVEEAIELVNEEGIMTGYATRETDTYMPKVSQEWSGAIPATLFVTDLGKKFFHEKAFAKEDLEKAVEEYLN